jgi:ribosome biogenesis GTPase
LPATWAGRTGALLGSSGVGKSTLVNALIGEESSRPRRAGARFTRPAYDRASQFDLPPDHPALLVDHAGHARAAVVVEGEGARARSDDILELAQGCHFRDCRHRDEPRCAVKQAVEGTCPIVSGF